MSDIVDTVDTTDTVVLFTRFPGELQLYFASVVQQTSREAEISLITGHDIKRKTYVALRQNRLVYLIGKLKYVQEYHVQLILSLINEYNNEFLEDVILIVK